MMATCLNTNGIEAVLRIAAAPQARSCSTGGTRLPCRCVPLLERALLRLLNVAVRFDNGVRGCQENGVRQLPQRREASIDTPRGRHEDVRVQEDAIGHGRAGRSRATRSGSMQSLRTARRARA